MCIDRNSMCPQDIGNALSDIKGKNFISSKRKIKKIIDANFMVLEYYTQFKLPDVIEVHILTKKPSFAINFENDKDSFYLVDSAGYVLGKSNQSALPKITLSENRGFDIGKKVDEKTLLALNLIDGIFKMYQTGTGTISEGNLIVDLPDGIKVIFPLENADRDYLLGSLRLIYSNIKNEKEKTYSQIDMRYDNPVLR